MIFCKYIKHAEKLYLNMPDEIRKKYRVGILHNQVSAGNKTLDDFRDGKIDILIATHLIQEGHNLPLIKFAINAGGSDSAITITQWVGRMLRTHKSKKRVYIEDIYDLGRYMKRHSRHRVNYYLAEKFTVIKQYKRTAKRKGIKYV